jgi:hypothetical protein
LDLVFYVIARSMTQNHVNKDKTWRLWRWHLVTHGQPRVHKALEKYVVIHTYIHIYMYTSKAGTRGVPLVLGLWGPDIIFHVQDGLLLVFQASSIYLLSKVVCFVLFATLRSPKPWRIHSCSWCLQKALRE